MRTKSVPDIVKILEMSPRSCMRMYSVLNYIDNDELEVYINKTAILIKAWSLMLWTKEEQDLIPLLDEITADGPLGLHCVEYRLLRVLEENLTVESVDPCYSWEMTALAEKPPQLDSLTVNDAEYVNERWEYTGDDTLEFITECLRDNPSSCYRDENNKPVAYSFCYGQSPEHINMGGLIVDPGYRRRGMGRNIALDLANKVLKRKKKPLVHIRVDNEISMRLSNQAGFERKEKVFWGRLQLS